MQKLTIISRESIEHPIVNNRVHSDLIGAQSNVRKIFMHIAGHYTQGFELLLVLV